MTRQEIKDTIKNAVQNKIEKITIEGNFGCGHEVFEIAINHIHKVFACKECVPLCVLTDVYQNGYRTLVVNN